jgi:hypothetical protein
MYSCKQVNLWVDIRIDLQLSWRNFQILLQYTLASFDAINFAKNDLYFFIVVL